MRGKHPPRRVGVEMQALAFTRAGTPLQRACGTRDPLRFSVSVALALRLLNRCVRQAAAA
jgi:hypothetical protein